ncbi:unnamed protein product [Bursaphelenchus okinawaensis]|uniref:non-specific serine/threonine protein kinase n=1 Tax=Bursaphelenchus okinawaensis TaxID=465554 RepID=A0A811JQP0_9BILA|nr:unnamed protein product [Bursaphelenchus okinawaensis]CAG9078103.1 unnamed protein product [Bursaphelenchus okinawaensis]
MNKIIHRVNTVKRERGTEDFVKLNHVFANRYYIEKELGKGGFGQVYQAKDLRTSNIIALKVEPDDRHNRMIMEVKVLAQVIGCKHFNIMYDHGLKNAALTYISMPVLGENLFELRRLEQGRKFKPEAMLEFFSQLVDALETLHKKGFLHRDLKPSNFVMGKRPGDRDTVYLIDFGMAREYLHPNGQRRAVRYPCQFRGTTRYSTARAHKGLEQGPGDDMYSLLYGMVELCEGDLPWRGDEPEKGLINIKGMPRSGLTRFIKHTPKELLIIAQYLDGLVYEDDVDYNYIRQEIHEAFDSLHPPVFDFFGRSDNFINEYNTNRSPVTESTTKSSAFYDPYEVKQMTKTSQIIQMRTKFDELCFNEKRPPNRFINGNVYHPSGQKGAIWQAPFEFEPQQERY